MKKSTCFIVGSFVGLCAGMVAPFVLADKCDNHCIYWRKVKDGYTDENIYGNRDLFPELNKEEETSE